jgi:hypothetical protein
MSQYGAQKNSQATAMPEERIMGDDAHGLAGVGAINFGDEGRSPSNGGNSALLADREGLRRRWESVQAGFVDNPQGAVGEAEELVSSVIDELVTGFQRQRQSLEASWAGGGEVSTDQLRASFKRYREFFDRLLLV